MSLAYSDAITESDIEQMAKSPAKSTKPAANANSTSAADLLGQLANLTPTTNKPKASGKQQWEITLTGNDAVVFERWINAKMVSEVTEARLETAKDELSEYAMNIIAQSLWKSKTRPLNPTFMTKKGTAVDSKSVFLFTDKFKCRFPDVPDDVVPRNHFIQVFVDVGLEEKDAAKLVDNELDIQPVIKLRPLTELTQGRYGEKRQWIDATPEEQEAGRKLMSYLMGLPEDDDGNCTVPALTPEERALVLQRDPGIKVKAGFYGRVCQYCHSVEQLKAIFKVLIPVAYPAHQKFAMNDAPDQRASRLTVAAADIIGVGLVEADKSDED